MNKKKILAANWWMGGANYTPLSFSGLQYWYDISQETGFSDNDLMPQITDLSGNGHHLVQATGASQANYKTNIQGGQPGLLFAPAGSQFYTPINGNADTNFLHTGPSTVIWIVKAVGAQTQKTLFDDADTVASSIGRTTSFSVNSGADAFLDAIWNGTGTRVAGGTTITGKAPEGETILIVSRYKSGYSNPDELREDFEISIGGVNMFSEDTQSAASASGSTFTARFFCDKDFANLFRGYFFWGAAWNRDLSATELNQLLGGASYGL